MKDNQQNHAQRKKRTMHAKMGIEMPPPSVTAPSGGEGYGSLEASDSPYMDFTAFPAWVQAKVAPCLGQGKDTAQTAQQIADLLGCSWRDVSAAIERERQAGVPICASSDSRCPGYFLPATVDELTEYRQSLRHRVTAVSRTLEAIENVHDELTGQQHIDRGGAEDGETQSGCKL